MADHGASGLRLPEFLTRAETIQELNETDQQCSQMNPADRLKLRPDIMLVGMPASEADILKTQATGTSVKRSRDGRETLVNRSSDLQKGYNIRIIEIGYCSDTRYEAKEK